MGESPRRFLPFGPIERGAKMPASRHGVQDVFLIILQSDLSPKKKKVDEPFCSPADRSSQITHIKRRCLVEIGDWKRQVEDRPHAPFSLRETDLTFSRSFARSDT